MNGFIYRLLALLALLLIQAHVARVAAETTQQPVPTLPALTYKDSSPPDDLRLARPLSRSEEDALIALDHFRECERCPEMIVIPAGTFTMGASADESGSTADERPQHRVSLPGFAVGRFPVSLDEWNACVLGRGCSFRPFGPTTGGARQPVTNILWEEAREYVEWLSRATGRPYRLLSESEREYVARAGTTTAFWWGDSPTSSEDRVEERQLAESSFLPPAPSIPNPWGLHEVHGSVYDWVEDCWHDNYLGAPADGSAWIEADCSRHVLRGGAPSRAMQTRRAAARMWFGSPNRLLYMSVRVARTLRR
jgi:formylglycine-generating enzyme required for sulfatase activity